ncbi:MAG: RluA family pseudouridine synthase [Deltaproteobacteria bacterium]
MRVEGSFTVERAGLRIDRALADLLGCGRREARRLLATGLVSIDGRRTTAGQLTRAGSELTVAAGPAARPEAPVAEPRVLWRGGGLVAVAKPAGIHSQRGRSGRSVDDYLERTEPGFAADGPGGVLHRIDRDTSGLILASSEAGVYRGVRGAFARGEVEKQYLALVEGRVDGPLVIDIALARRRTRVVRACRRDRVLEASTTVRPLEVGADWSLVLAVMRTGVTHQVRAHLSLAGHPLFGDTKYGGPPVPPGTRSGQLLHALRVRWPRGPDLAVGVAADFGRAYAALRT